MTTKTGIIYLQRDRFQLYSPYLPNILEFRFVPELIRDFDLVSHELLENLLKVFMANNKVPPSGIVIIITDGASFMKDFVSPPPAQTPPGQPPTPPPTLEDLHVQATQYLDHIPFEVVASKVFPLATGVRAFATNQEIYEGIKTVLEKQGFIIQAVLPGFIFGPNLSNRPALDGPSVGIILQKFGTLQGYNLLKEVVPIPESTLPSDSPGGDKDTQSSEEDSGSDKTMNKKVLTAVAISVIALIVIIAGGIIFSQFQQKPYTPPPPAPVTQSSAPAPQVSPAAAIPDAKDLTVQITSPASATDAAALRLTLMTYGFKSVVPQTQEGGTQNLLIFSPKVSPLVKAAVTAEVKKIAPTVVAQDKTDSTTDIIIILGK